MAWNGSRVSSASVVRHTDGRLSHDATKRPAICLATNPGAPYLARSSRDVGGDRWSPLYNPDRYPSQCSGIPHLAKNHPRHHSSPNGEQIAIAIRFSKLAMDWLR